MADHLCSKCIHMSNDFLRDFGWADEMTLFYDCNYLRRSKNDQEKDLEGIEFIHFRRSEDRPEVYIPKCPHFRQVPYSEWMETDAWRKKRTERLKLDGYKCQLCGSAKNLCVHHITYENMCHEPLDDLLTVCKTCHEKLHEEDIKRKEET